MAAIKVWKTVKGQGILKWRLSGNPESSNIETYLITFVCKLHGQEILFVITKEIIGLGLRTDQIFRYNICIDTK